MVNESNVGSHSRLMYEQFYLFEKLVGLPCYNNINNELYDAYEKAAECSKKIAGQEVKHLKDM